MRVAVMINDFGTLVPSQATAMMVRSLSEQADEVAVFGVEDLYSDSRTGIHARCRIVRGALPTPQAAVEALGELESSAVRLSGLDALLIRTNPGRDHRPWLQENALRLLAIAADAGLDVINSPKGLHLAGSKVFLASLPAETIPPTFISSNPTEIVSWVRGRDEPSVLKPATGTRGNDVFKVGPESKNLRAIADMLSRQGMVVAQGFVAEAVDGDTRVILLDGEPLAVNGHEAAIRRVPPAGEFRSNIHVGGSPEPGVISDAMRATVSRIAPLLNQLGLRLVGLDFLGSVVCEVNVFSTGGFRDAERFFDTPFMDAAVRGLLSSRN
ncbi:MAG: hypothetical protein KC561_10005 [Myxococcales bacterium]|nr:hypothetical protein [Myxococcales bacterium]